MSFKNKIVLITGGTSGIGEATASAFIRENAFVIITGRSKEKGVEALSRIDPSQKKTCYIQADIGDRSSVEALFRQIEKDYGRLDIACNGAAIKEVVGKLTADWTEEEYDLQMNPNLKGTWRCMKHEISLMLKNGGGNIVNISSINGLGGAAGAALYSSAKHGVVGLTKSAAIEYAKQNIRINAFCAGMFDTQMLNHVFKSANPSNPEQVRTMFENLIPLMDSLGIGNISSEMKLVRWEPMS